MVTVACSVRYIVNGMRWVGVIGLVVVHVGIAFTNAVHARCVPYEGDRMTRKRLASCTRSSTKTARIRHE